MVADPIMVPICAGRKAPRDTVDEAAKLKYSAVLLQEQWFTSYGMVFDQISIVHVRS